MKRDDVYQRVRSIVCDVLGVEFEKVVETAKYEDDLGADSLDAVELIMEFEKEFGRYIPEEELDNWDNMTVGDSVDFLMKYLKK